MFKALSPQYQFAIVKQAAIKITKENERGPSARRGQVSLQTSTLPLFR